MFNDLSPEVVEREVNFPSFTAFPFSLIAFDIPKFFGNSPLTTELRHRPVDCNTFHDRNNAVLFFTAVRVEQHLECTSCHTRFFFVAKL